MLVLFLFLAIISRVGGESEQITCIPPAANEDRVTVPALGQFFGLTHCHHRSFLGIPFAQPPVYDLRWRPPQPLEPAKQGTITKFNATLWKPSCVQLRSERLGEVGRMLVGVREESEDCLYLNIFTPRQHAVRGKLPVLVFIHGGAFSTGGSSAPLYNPTDLLVNGLDNEAVIVTFDYRLGVFGFAAGSALVKDSTSPVGNYGLQDQMAALEWVHKHIEHFNGDPLNITVMGHSAGAMSASYLQLVKPELAHKWVLLSGTAFGWKWRHAESAFESKLWSKLCEQAGCDSDDVDCMRQTSAAIIAAAGVSIKGDFLFGPTIDGRLIRDVPLNLPVSPDLGPTILTTVKDEASIFLSQIRTPADYEQTARQFFRDPQLIKQVLSTYTISKYSTAFNAANAAVTDAMFTCPALRYMDRLKAATSGVFFTQFDHSLPLPSFASMLSSGRDYGVFHGSDLVLLFNFNPFVTWPAVKQANEMRTGLKRFMMTGGPLDTNQPLHVDSVWTAGRQVQFKGSCQSVWGLLRGRPPLPLNFGSNLQLLEDDQ